MLTLYNCNNISNNDKVIMLIPHNYKNHFKLRKNILYLYIRDIITNEEFVLDNSNSDNKKQIYSFLNYSDKNKIKLFVLDKKEILYWLDYENIHYNHKDNILDVKLLYYIYNYKDINIENKTLQKIIPPNLNNGVYDNVNIYIPISQHYKYCHIISNHIVGFLNENNEYINNSEYIFYNSKAINIFYEVEKDGLKIDLDIFNLHFKNSQICINIDEKNKIIYQNYRFNTLAGRPSNNINNINFAALNKKTDIRKFIISSFKNKGILVEYDYSAYHLSLIAFLLNYKFPENTHIHRYLAEQYFKNQTITPELIDKSKEISFKILYGHKFEEYSHIPFFKLTNEFINILWEEYSITGKKIIPLINRFNPNINNPGVLFNYILQNLETKNNISILEKIFDYLHNNNLKSKVILYGYDSILLDFYIDDGVNIIKDIEQILCNDEQFLIHIKYGVNYKDLNQMIK